MEQFEGLSSLCSVWQLTGQNSTVLYPLQGEAEIYEGTMTCLANHLDTIAAKTRANKIPKGTYLEWLLKELPKAEARPRKGRLDLFPFLPWAFKAHKAAT